MVPWSCLWPWAWPLSGRTSCPNGVSCSTRGRLDETNAETNANHEYWGEGGGGLTLVHGRAGKAFIRHGILGLGDESRGWFASGRGDHRRDRSKALCRAMSEVDFGAEMFSRLHWCCTVFSCRRSGRGQRMGAEVAMLPVELLDVVG